VSFCSTSLSLTHHSHTAPEHGRCRPHRQGLRKRRRGRLRPCAPVRQGLLRLPLRGREGTPEPAVNGGGKRERFSENQTMPPQLRPPERWGDRLDGEGFLSSREEATKPPGHHESKKLAPLTPPLLSSLA
jgi:hypothetical protein